MGVAYGNRILGTEELPKLGEANAKEDLLEKVKVRTRMMMAEKKMMRMTMLQRENTWAWASYREHNASLTMAAELL